MDDHSIIQYLDMDKEKLNQKEPRKKHIVDLKEGQSELPFEPLNKHLSKSPKIQKNQFPNMLLVNPSNQTQSNEPNQEIYNLTPDPHDLNFLVEKLVSEDSSENDEEPIPEPFLKNFSLKLNDKKMYNTLWISRLDQMARPVLIPAQLTQNIDLITEISNEKEEKMPKNASKNITKVSKNVSPDIAISPTTSKTFEIKFEIKYPPNFKPSTIIQTSSFFQEPEKQKIKETDTSQKQDSLSEGNESILDEDIEINFTYYSGNQIVENFIEDSLDEKLFPSAQFSIRSFLTHSQLMKISKNYDNFWTYVRKKPFNDLFLVRVLSLEDVLNNTVQNVSLLEKVVALRKYFDFKKKVKEGKKKANQPEIFLSVPSFLVSQKFELHGRKELLQELWDIFGGKNERKFQEKNIEKNESINISFSLRVDHSSTSKEVNAPNIRFVRFIPPLNIHQNNYQKFYNHFSEIKKAYFNGISVGFKGFRISNFTTRSENNIIFVFQNFDELVSLQSLLIDFQVQLNYIEFIKNQYEKTKNRPIKKIKIKERLHDDNNPWTQEMFQKSQTSSFFQPINKNMSYSIMDNVTMMRPLEPKRVLKRESTLNISSVNSSFFLNPIGYCENSMHSIIDQQGRKSKEIFFCKIDKQNPDYEKLVRHLNSISEVSKTVIINFEKMFELFKLKNKLTSLINVCCQFEAADVQLLPQPLQIVKVHEDYKSKFDTIHDQAKELLENEEKFACLNLPNTQTKINSINCFNIIKMNEEYQPRLQLFKRIKEKYSEINGDNQIFNQKFEESINTVEFIIPNEKAKNEFVCFPFHNRTFKIARYFEPGTNNLIDLQLKETNERTQNFVPSQETTFNQYKQRMIKQGVDYFYFCYPFGEKFKLNLKANNLYSLGLRNEEKFRKEDHLRVMYWLGRINRAEYKIVFQFYQKNNAGKSRQELGKAFMREMMPQFEEVYEFGFLEESLKEKIKQFEVYKGKDKTKNEPKIKNLIFKKSIHKFLLSSHSYDRNGKSSKVQAYKIQTNRTIWDLVLKKLQTVCQEKETQLRRRVVSEQDDLEFQAVKKALKSVNY